MSHGYFVLQFVADLVVYTSVVDFPERLVSKTTQYAERDF